MFRLLQILLPVDDARSMPALIGRAVLLAGLIAWTLPYFTMKIIVLGKDPGWMHHVHLVFHEAGHAITAMLTDNRTAVVFMGSGLQVLFPLIVAGAFYFVNKDAFAAALGLWWAGHAALDVAPYIGDARLLNLELLTGGTGKEVEGHDWEYLLEHWGVLHRDIFIAAQVAKIARLVMLFAFAWAAAALLFEAYLRAGAKESAELSEATAGKVD